jgi:hypothetical protein
LAFNLNLRRYTKLKPPPLGKSGKSSKKGGGAGPLITAREGGGAGRRGIKRLAEEDFDEEEEDEEGERRGFTLVPIPAQLELTLPLTAQLWSTVSPIQPNVPRGCGPKVLKLSSNVSDASQRSSS